MGPFLKSVCTGLKAKHIKKRRTNQRGGKKTERDLSAALGLVDDLQRKLFSRGPEEKQRN